MRRIPKHLTESKGRRGSCRLSNSWKTKTQNQNDIMGWGSPSLPITLSLKLIGSHFSKCVSPSISLSLWLSLCWLLSSSGWTMVSATSKSRKESDGSSFRQVSILVQSKGWERWVTHEDTTGSPAPTEMIGPAMNSPIPLWTFWKESACLFLCLTVLALPAYCCFFVHCRFLWAGSPAPIRPAFIQDFLIECELPADHQQDRTGDGCSTRHPGQSHGACIPAGKTATKY